MTKERKEGRASFAESNQVSLLIPSARFVEICLVFASTSSSVDIEQASRVVEKSLLALACFIASLRFLHAQQNPRFMLRWQISSAFR